VGAEAVSAEELEELVADEGRRRRLTAERGLEEISRKGWDSFVVVADSGGIPSAARLAHARPDAVEALALGHACLSLERDGARAPVNKEVWSAIDSLVDQDREQFIRHAITQLTGGSYDEEMAARMVERVPIELFARTWQQRSGQPVGELIRQLDCPLLFVKHEGCLMFTDEGFDDAVAAFPRAETGAVGKKPSVSPEFADLLREFCEATPAS